MKGMILAAGIGSRLKPWTDHHPKALVTLGGIPMLRHAINALTKAGITDIIINVHHKADQILEYLRENPTPGVKITVSDETKQLLDTGGAIVNVTSLIGDEPILIYNADIFCTLDLSFLVNAHIQSNHDVTMLVSDRKSTRRLIFNKDFLLKGWINIPENKTLPKDLSIKDEDMQLSYNGIQILNPHAVNVLTTLHPTGPFPIIPAYLKLINKIKIAGFNPGDSTYGWVDIGTPEKLELAQEIFRTLTGR